MGFFDLFKIPVRGEDPLTYEENKETFEIIGTALDNWTKVETIPETSSDVGIQGTFNYDADYLYLCTATDTWRKAAINSFDDDTFVFSNMLIGKLDPDGGEVDYVCFDVQNEANKSIAYYMLWEDGNPTDKKVYAQGKDNYKIHKEDGAQPDVMYEVKAYDATDTELFTSSVFYLIGYPQFKFLTMNAGNNPDTGEDYQLSFTVINESNDGWTGSVQTDISDYDIYEVSDPGTILGQIPADQTNEGYYYFADPSFAGLELAVKAIRVNSTLPDYRNLSDLDFGLSVQMPV